MKGLLVTSITLLALANAATIKKEKRSFPYYPNAIGYSQVNPLTGYDPSSQVLLKNVQSETAYGVPSLVGSQEVGYDSSSQLFNLQPEQLLGGLQGLTVSAGRFHGVQGVSVAQEQFPGVEYDTSSLLFRNSPQPGQSLEGIRGPLFSQGQLSSTQFNPQGPLFSQGQFSSAQFNPQIAKVTPFSNQNVINKAVPVYVSKPVPYYVTKQVSVPTPYNVTVIKPYAVPVKVNVPVEILKPYAVKIDHKVPVPVPERVPVEIPRPYPVYKTKEVQIEIEKPVYVKEKIEVRVPVPKPYRVEVPYPVHVRVPQRIEIKVPQIVGSSPVSPYENAAVLQSENASFVSSGISGSLPFNQESFNEASLEKSFPNIAEQALLTGPSGYEQIFQNQKNQFLFGGNQELQSSSESQSFFGAEQTFGADQELQTYEEFRKAQKGDGLVDEETESISVEGKSGSIFGSVESRSEIFDDKSDVGGLDESSTLAVEISTSGNPVSEEISEITGSDESTVPSVTTEIL